MNWFWNTKIENNVLGINERNLDFIYPNNPRTHFPLADDKIVCKEILTQHRISCADTYGVIERIGDIETVWKTLAHHQKLAIKPAKGAGGGGILIVRKDDQGQWWSSGEKYPLERIYTHLARIMMGMYSYGNSDRVLIEQCIEPHPFFHEIYPAGVPDFRVILLRDQPVMSMLRVPTRRSKGKANLHQGGLGIGIDMQTGKLREAFDGQTYHDCHPDNQQLINGKSIPDWPKLLELSVQTSKAFPLDYLGVDLVIDRSLGPMVMEINVRPGLGIQLANRQGLKPTLQALSERVS